MSGYKSRKAMKRAMYQRAKVHAILAFAYQHSLMALLQSLYDNAYDDDMLSLIQSVILLGFWYTDAEDRFEAWHWIGIAISLSQTLGLHRSPELVNANHRVSAFRQRLLRRIWWSCFVRDRWLSLVKGRPMRINLEDCDLLFPQVDDIKTELEEIPKAVRDRYIPYEPLVLGQAWNKLVKISRALGNILKIHYKTNGPKAGTEDIDRCEKEIAECVLTSEESDQSHPHMRVFACHIRLCLE